MKGDDDVIIQLGGCQATEPMKCNWDIELLEFLVDCFFCLFPVQEHEGENGAMDNSSNVGCHNARCQGGYCCDHDDDDGILNISRCLSSAEASNNEIWETKEDSWETREDSWETKEES